MIRNGLSRCLWAAKATASRKRAAFLSLLSSPPTPISRSSFSSSARPPSSPTGAASADLEEGEDEDYIYSETSSLNPSSSSKVGTIPTLLQPRVVVFDGVCHLCHRGVKWVIKADKYEKIKFCCLQSRAAEPYLRVCGVDREDVLRRFLFIEGPEAYYEGSTAALKVASYLPFPYSTLSSLLIMPAPVRDAVYDYVAKQRYNWFGKADQCIITQQDQELLDRFIDRDEILSGGGDNDRFF